jgi:dihydroneopterin aldolase
MVGVQCRTHPCTTIPTPSTQALALDMATIEMDVHLHAEIGIAPSELGRQQALVVALRVVVADHHSDRAARSGHIADTLDYSLLRQIVLDTFKARRYDLLEEVTTLIRDQICLLEHVASAQVGITKSHPWADVPRLTLTR